MSAAHGASHHWKRLRNRLQCRPPRLRSPLLLWPDSTEALDEDMWLILIEALVALCLLVLIVWLTMAPPRRRDNETADTGPDRPGDDKP